jgi:hypothetical protein
MLPHPAISHAEVNSQEENLRHVKALWSHTMPQILFLPIHTCQVPHMVRFQSITLCSDAACTLAKARRKVWLTNIGYDFNQID